MRDYHKDISKYFPPTTAFDTPLTAVRAEGAEMLCHDGKTYLDFSSGVAVLNIGHRPPRVVEAIREQLDSFLHVGDIFVHPAYVELAKKLRTLVPVERAKFFLTNAGTEAVEGCMKLARKASGRQGIVCFRGAFHGRTLGSVSVTTSSAKYRSGNRPLLGSVYRAPYPYCYRCPFGQKPSSCSYECVTNVEDLFRYEIRGEEVAAILIEPMQGEGGYIPAPKKFLQAMRRLCDEYGIYLIFDEVQTGMGRTGRWFAAEHSGVSPDILSLGKGIASGLPLAAVSARPEIMAKWTPGSHGSTFGGNPLSCAAALATIETIEEDKLLAKSRRNSKMIFERLEKMKKKHSVIGDVRGAGYFIGIELVKSRRDKQPNPAAREKVLAACLRKGLVLMYCGVHGNVLRILPPLVATEDQITRALDILDEAIRKVCR